MPARLSLCRFVGLRGGIAGQCLALVLVVILLLLGVFVKVILLDVLNDWLGNEVPNRHVSLQEQPDFCAGNIILSS